MLNNTWIGIIVFLSFLTSAMLVVGILAIKQQQKIKNFKKSFNKLQNRINANKEYLMIDDNPIMFKYPLPEEERGYYTARNVFLSQINNKKELHRNNFYCTTKMNSSSAYHIENLVGYLNLRPATETFEQRGTIYVTNKRVLLETTTTSLTIWIKDINYCFASVFNLNGSYQTGFFISTKDNIYRFITNDDKISMCIFKQWKGI